MKLISVELTEPIPSVREDGVGIDEGVLSPSNYLATSPGALKNDTHIVPR